MLHLALRRTLRSLLCRARHLVNDRILCHHINHDKSDGAVIAANACDSCEQVTAVIVINNHMPLRSAELVTIRKVEPSMHKLTFIIDLCQDKRFGLNTVDPLRDGINCIFMHFSGRRINDPRAGGLRQRKTAQVAVGRIDPIGLAAIVNFKGWIGQAVEPPAEKARVTRQILHQIIAGLVLYPVIFHILHIVDICSGHQNISGRSGEVCQPFEKT